MVRASVFLLALWSTSAIADAPLRLLMFDAEDCSYCARWRDEVGAVYARTQEGRRAPLEERLLVEGPPDGVKLREPVLYTPTFVLLDVRGQELGRITGYPGEAHFWGLLHSMLAGGAGG